MRVIWFGAYVLFSLGIFCPSTESVAVPKLDGDELASIYRRLNETIKNSQASVDEINLLLVAFDEGLQQYEFSIFEYFTEIEPYITKDALMEFLQEVHKKAMTRVGQNIDNEIFNFLREPFMHYLNHTDLLLRNMLTAYDNCLYKKDDSILNMLNNMEDDDVLSLHHNLTAQVDRKRYCKSQSMLMSSSQPITGAFSKRSEKLKNLFGKLMNYAIEYKQKKHYFISKVKKNWFDANIYCLNRGMRLVAIRSEEEWQEVLKSIEDGYAPITDSKFYKRGEYNNYPGFWTSGKQLHGKTFYWFSHNDEMTTTKWDFNEPNDWNHIGEQCIEIQNYWYGNGLKWNDRQCSDTKFVICEY